ncbi:MAG: hypothetical protein ACKOU6_09340 [Planctomycetota bacterium]
MTRERFSEKTAEWRSVRTALPFLSRRTNDQLIGATNEQELMRNAWHLDRMIEHINSVKQIERLVPADDRPKVIQLQQQMEKLLSQRLRQHRIHNEYVIMNHNFDNAMRWLESFK